MYCNSFISTCKRLLIQTFVKGVGYLTPDFFTNFSSSTPSQAGIKGALAGTIWLMISIIPISIVLGVGTAIYLEEYAKDNFFTSFVKISISNLAGVPSIVFGLLGLTLFVRGGGIQALALGNSVILCSVNNVIVNSTDHYRIKSGGNQSSS